MEYLGGGVTPNWTLKQRPREKKIDILNNQANDLSQ